MGSDVGVSTCILPGGGKPGVGVGSELEVELDRVTSWPREDGGQSGTCVGKGSECNLAEYDNWWLIL